MTGDEFQPGDRVTIRPRAFPLQRWRGEILRRTPNGFSVRYEAFNVRCRDTFSAAELTREPRQ